MRPATSFWSFIAANWSQTTFRKSTISIASERSWTSIDASSMHSDLMPRSIAVP